MTFAILLATAPGMAGSLFDTPGSNPATNRCELYDPNCRPRQLFARPPEPSIRKNPFGEPARKLILPRDLNDRSSDPSPILLLPNSSTRSTLTCSEARLVIRYEGYRNIRTLKCGGKYHQFSARKRGAIYLVNLKVRTTTGEIVVVGRIR
ncbi:MAG: hypothetical protein Q7T14_03040 [Aestuariivirga sp.]|nr:hypothetical protein [Aestuariivirga sp.]